MFKGVSVEKRNRLLYLQKHEHLIANVFESK